ncbi:replication/maintenance protein RepL [Serratia fonticola]
MSTGSINKKLDFMRLFRQGCSRLRGVMRQNKTAADLFLYLAENADMNTGAIAVDQAVLAKELLCSERHVRRAIKLLEDEGFVRRPTPNVFAINPADIWSGYDNSMRSSLYMTMDQGVAKKVRYMFNPKASNMISVAIGVVEDKKPEGGTLASASHPALEDKTDA